MTQKKREKNNRKTKQLPNSFLFVCLPECLVFIFHFFLFLFSSVYVRPARIATINGSFVVDFGFVDVISVVFFVVLDFGFLFEFLWLFGLIMRNLHCSIFIVLYMFRCNSVFSLFIYGYDKWMIGMDCN